MPDNERDELYMSITDALALAPSASFRAGLRRRLELAAANQRRTTMTTTQTASYVRPGLATLTPYLILPDADAFLTFAQAAFGAELVASYPTPDGKIMHAELRIGDSVIEFAGANENYPAHPFPLHLYVPNVDEVHARAIAAGATSLTPVTEQPYGDREFAIRDPFGNNWYVATHRATGHAPAGLRSVTPYLHPAGAAAFIDFAEKAFGAETLDRYADPSGRIAHCKMRLGDSVLELSDAHGQWKPMPATLHLYVENVDATYRAALAAGAKGEDEPANKPYGDRAATVRDPQGNQWFLAQYLGEG